MINKKPFSTVKKLIVFGSVILSMFLVVNVFWLMTIHLPYSQYASKLEVYEEGGLIFYKKEIDDYVFSLKRPCYLGTGGFLCVESKAGYMVQLDDNGDIVSSNGLDVTLYIWPNFWGEDKYGVFFYDEKEGVFEQVYVDEQLNYLSDDPYNVELNQYIRGLIEQNKQEISLMLEEAVKLWALEE